jgi:phenylacetate-CoA ligase
VFSHWSQQRDRLVHLLRRVNESNPFYRERFLAASLDVRAIDSPESFARIPFTTKADLVADQVRHPPYGRNRTVDVDRYTRLHQSSGTTTGHPLRWLDTPDGWDWVVNSWRMTFPEMGFRPDDRLFFPFSFGPFLGFWSAFEAGLREGYFCFSGGGMTSTSRLRQVIDHGITIVFATPTYALHLVEVAFRDGIDLVSSSVRSIVVAGEPGGGIAATKQRIEAGWGARVFDHYGMSEVGPIAFESADDPEHLLAIEKEMIVEVIEPSGENPVPPGTMGELVVTNLGRVDSPVIRYRTGDLVCVSADRPTGKYGWMRFSGGVRGRADDMIHVRGNNLYPAALEAVVRRFPSVVEFRIVVNRSGSLADLAIEIEPATDVDSLGLTAEIGRALRDEFLFRIDVTAVPPGTLPRFEMKSRRVVLK